MDCCIETPDIVPVPTPEVIPLKYISLYFKSERDDANLLVEIHIEYLDEIGLPTVVLGEGDGAREPLHPGGVVAHRV